MLDIVVIRTGPKEVLEVRCVGEQELLLYYPVPIPCASYAGCGPVVRRAGMGRYQCGNTQRTPIRNPLLAISYAKQTKRKVRKVLFMTVVDEEAEVVIGIQRVVAGRCVEIGLHHAKLEGNPSTRVPRVSRSLSAVCRASRCSCNSTLDGGAGDAG